MQVTNQTSNDIYFGPLRLAANAVNVYIDDTTATSLYLTNDGVADALNNAYWAGNITVSGQALPFPRPTGTPEILHGDGDPEGLVFADQGSLYMTRTAGSATNFLYTKTTGSHLSTGWQAINPGGSVVLLGSTLLGAATASIDTNTLLGGNIPQVYRNLRITMNAVGTSGHGNIGLQFSGDAGPNYDYSALYAFKNQAPAFTSGTTTSATILNALSATGYQPGPTEIQLNNYTDPTYRKAGSYRAGARDGNATGGIYISVGDFWWTANPITRIVFTPSIGSFDAGTSLALYAEA